LLSSLTLAVLFPAAWRQGEQLNEWRTREFRMFQGGSIWRPPGLKTYDSRDTGRPQFDHGTPQEEEEEEEGKKGQLKSE